MVKILSLLWRQLLGVSHYINMDSSVHEVSYKYVVQQHFLAHSTSTLGTINSNLLRKNDPKKSDILYGCSLIVKSVAIEIIFKLYTPHQIYFLTSPFKQAFLAEIFSTKQQGTSYKNADCETQDFTHVIFRDIAGVFRDHFKNVVSYLFYLRKNLWDGFAVN